MPGLNLSAFENNIACVAGGIRERASEGGAAYYLVGLARKWNSRLPHFVWFLLAAHLYAFW